MRETTEDISAVQAVLGGDTGAFRHIVRTYAPQVERLVSAHVLPHEVPELAQETFVPAYRSLGSYSGRGSLSGWLAVIALCCCYERLRKRYRPEAAFSSLHTPRMPEGSDEEMFTTTALLRRYNDNAEQQHVRETLDNALTTLPPRDRMPLTLTFLGGYSVAEAAAMLGLSGINARVRSHRSKARLRHTLREQWPESFSGMASPNADETMTGAHA